MLQLALPSLLRARMGSRLLITAATACAVLIALALGLCPARAQALPQTTTWVGGNTADPRAWAEPLNWNTGITPVSGDTAVIPPTADAPLVGAPIMGTDAPDTITIASGGALEIGAAELDTNTAIDNAGTITLDDQSIVGGAGVVTNQAGGTITTLNASTNGAEVAATIAANDGTIAVPLGDQLLLDHAAAGLTVGTALVGNTYDIAGLLSISDAAVTLTDIDATVVSIGAQGAIFDGGAGANLIDSTTHIGDAVSPTLVSVTAGGSIFTGALEIKDHGTLDLAGNGPGAVNVASALTVDAGAALNATFPVNPGTDQFTVNVASVSNAGSIYLADEVALKMAAGDIDSSGSISVVGAAQLQTDTGAIHITAGTLTEAGFGGVIAQTIIQSGGTISGSGSFGQGAGSVFDQTGGSIDLAFGDRIRDLGDFTQSGSGMLHFTATSAGVGAFEVDGLATVLAHGTTVDTSAISTTPLPYEALYPGSTATALIDGPYGGTNAVSGGSYAPTFSSDPSLVGGPGQQEPTAAFVGRVQSSGIYFGLVESTPPSAPSGVHVTQSGMTISGTFTDGVDDANGSGAAGTCVAIDTTQTVSALSVCQSSVWTGTPGAFTATTLGAGTYYVHLVTVDLDGNRSIVTTTVTSTQARGALIVTVRAVARSQTLPSVLAKGLTRVVHCNVGCRVRSTLTITAKQAKRIGILARGSKRTTPVVIGTASARSRAAGNVRLITRIGAKFRRALVEVPLLRLQQTFVATSIRGKLSKLSTVVLHNPEDEREAHRHG